MLPGAGKLVWMRTTLPSAAAVRAALALGAFGCLFILAAPGPRRASAADEPPEAVTRTYDVYDFLWYSGDSIDSGRGEWTHRSLSDELLSLVTETVAPETWQGAGGTNVVKEQHGRLIVTAPAALHKQIDTLIG